MRGRRAPLPVSPLAAAVIAIVCTLGGAPRHAPACSGDRPLHHLLGWLGDGRAVLAAGGGWGRLVRLPVGPALPEVLRRAPSISGAAAISPSGRWLVTLEEGPWNTACVAGSLTVARTDLTTGARTVIVRMEEDLNVTDAGARLSPGGRYVAGWLSTDPGMEVRVFDLVRRRAAYSFAARDAVWADETTLVVRHDDGLIEWVRMADGAAVAEIGPRAGVERILLPGLQGSRSAFLEVGPGPRPHASLAVAHLRPRRLSVERRPWPRREVPISISADGRQVVALRPGMLPGRAYGPAAPIWEAGLPGPRGFATISPSDPQVVVVDRRSGRVLAGVAGQRHYTNAALSPNGRSIAVISREDPTEPPDGIDFPSSFPVTVEVLDLATGRRRAWGARPRSRLLRGS